MVRILKTKTWWCVPQGSGPIISLRGILATFIKHSSNLYKISPDTSQGAVWRRRRFPNTETIKFYFNSTNSAGPFLSTLAFRLFFIRLQGKTELGKKKRKKNPCKNHVIYGSVCRNCWKKSPDKIRSTIIKYNKVILNTTQRPSVELWENSRPGPDSEIIGFYGNTQAEL